MIINFDLENNPLLIKSDSIIGGGQRVKIKFLTAQHELAGGLTIRLVSTPVYWIWGCSDDFTTFPTDFPSETDKILKMEKLSGSDYIRFRFRLYTINYTDKILKMEKLSGSDYIRFVLLCNVSHPSTPECFACCEFDKP